MLPGLRVRKILKLAPGLRVNLSKSGGSLSVGGKGFTVNLGRKGTRSTVGLPGSGLSYSRYEKRDGKYGWLWTVLLIAAAATIYYLKENN
ncbi:MAG: DUF4236 domain-containing protein [Alphaproteobacteria bacterium]|nr:DUF4236 domain-containing protein [Alphaproteobacteria bacterium]